MRHDVTGGSPTIPFCGNEGNCSAIGCASSSPHPNAAPCLFADGTVRSITYTSGEASDTTNFIARLWAWNDGQVITNLP